MIRILSLILFATFSLKSFSQTKEQLSQLTVIKFSCHGVDTMSLSLFRENDIISAQFASKGSNVGLTPKSSSLSSKQYAYYQQFVRELKKLKEGGGCTSVYVYRLDEKGKAVEKADGNCEWFGIEKLLKELFLE